jgi:5-methylcytosine-specific restriction endonuclease McrA
MKTPGINWYIGVNASKVRKDISKVGLPSGFPVSLIGGFVRWAANQRLTYESDLKEEAEEYLKSTYLKNLDWINKKKKHNLFSRIIDRDGAYCVNCRSTNDLTIDHIHPRSKGGSNDIENLRILCRKCNSSKGDRI